MYSANAKQILLTIKIVFHGYGLEVVYIKIVFGRAVCA